MLIAVKLIGVLAIGLGVIFLFGPKLLRSYLLFWQKGKVLYVAGVLRFVFGVVFLLAASECRLAGVIITLGILCLIGSILIFSLGLERLKSILKWWVERPLFVLRLMAIMMVAVGALIIYSV